MSAPLRTTLFAHALLLHQQHPDGPLPRDGEPYPDDQRYRHTGQTRRDRRLVGADVAAVLDAHFGRAGAAPSELADAFRDLDVPIHLNEHIAAAALRADRQRVRRTGRWLVRHSTDRCAATVGLALLAADHAEQDVPLIQTIGLLSDWFSPLAAAALRRRRGGGEALLWLAQRVAGWGRVYLVEELCRYSYSSSSAARRWLLRHSCDGDYLNGYFAGEVATAAHLSEAITGAEVDDELVDHTGRLLRIMADCGGMGMTLEDYPPAAVVLTAHAAQLGRRAPTMHRYVDAAVIADQVAHRAPGRSGLPDEHRDLIVRQYLAILDRPDWGDAVRAGLDPDDGSVRWFAGNVAARLRLRAFSDLTGEDS